MANKNVVIFIHGIGKHEAGWANGPGGPIETLTAASKDPAYGDVFSADNPLGASIKFEEIRYDDIFEEVRTQWQTLAQNLSNAGFDGASASSVAALQGFLPNALQTFAGVLDEDKWFATHALDAILYKGFRLVRQIVRYSVAAQLAKIAADNVQADRDDDPTYTIVAHSLGTAVAYDAIDLLGRAGWLKGVTQISDENLATQIDQATFDRVKSRYGANPFSSEGIWDWHGLVMLANVAPLFCSTPAPHSVDARVRPKHSGGTNGRSLENYFNVDHMFDPIGKVKPFSAMQTWPIAAREAFAFDVVGLRHFYDKNVHGFSHYLIHPSVHSRIFWLACPKRFRWSSVKKADERVGQGGFSNFGPDLTDDVKRLAMEKGLADIFAVKDRVTKEIDKYVGTINALGAFLNQVTL